MFSGYYNEFNKYLIITSNDKVKTKRQEEKNIYFYNKDNKIIGANIFKEGLESGIVSLKNMEISTEFKSDFDPFVFALIESIEKHPNSSKLKICKVNDGEKIKQIVCGAINVEAGKVVIVAQLGAIMPSGMPIISSKVAGIESDGMLCSYRELGKEQIIEGIAIFENKELIGKAFY